MGLPYSFEGGTLPWNRHREVHDLKKSFHYLLFETVSVVSVDALISLALAAGMFRRIVLVSMVGVPSVPYRDLRPDREAESHSQRNDT